MRYLWLVFVGSVGLSCLFMPPSASARYECSPLNRDNASTKVESEIHKGVESIMPMGAIVRCDSIELGIHSKSYYVVSKIDSFNGYCSFGSYLIARTDAAVEKTSYRRFDQNRALEIERRAQLNSSEVDLWILHSNNEGVCPSWNFNIYRIVTDISFSAALDLFKSLEDKRNYNNYINSIVRSAEISKVDSGLLSSCLYDRGFFIGSDRVWRIAGREVGTIEAMIKCSSALAILKLVLEGDYYKIVSVDRVVF